MTLDEAIKHAEEVEQEKRYEYQECAAVHDMEDAMVCRKCGEEHEQLAEWLKDYKRLLEQESPLDKIRAEIEALPKTYPFVNHFDMYVKVSDVTKIIDKYKAGEEYEDN